MKIKKLLFGAIIGLVNGFFSSGGGIIAVLVLKKLLNLDEKKAHATAIAVILPLTICSLFVYHSFGYTNLRLTFLCSIGGIAGAFIGAKLLTKLKKEYIRCGFGVVMIISAIRMIFFK